VKLLRSVSAVSSLTVAARKPTRIRTPQLSAINEYAQRADSDAETFQLHETNTERNEERTAPPPGVVVLVDVTASGFRKSHRLPLSITDTSGYQKDAEPHAESSNSFKFLFTRKSLRRVASSDSSKRQLCSSVSDLKSTSAIRSRSSRLEIYAPLSASTPASPSRARPTTVRQLKKRGRPGAVVEESGLCSSWRHSLCTASQSLDEDTTDLWAESRPSSAASAAALSRPRKISLTTAGFAKSADKSPLFRSHSLPRSFKNSLPIPLRRLLSSRTIASTKDAVSGSVSVVDESATVTDHHMTDEHEDKETVVRPEVAESSRSVNPIASKSNDGSGKMRSESLERVPNRRSFRRRSLPRIVSTGAHNFTVTPTGGDRSLADNHEVHVEIHDQPWTKPFATVKLRPYSNHVDDAESRRSSSGKFFNI